MEETISLRDILNTLTKRVILIVTTTLIAIILSCVITFFILTPKYEASTQVLVNQPQNENNGEISSTDLQSSRELISTYNVIMTSPAILERVIEQTNYEGSTSELRNQINVSAEEESQVATVTIEDTDPQNAVNLVNTLAQTFEQEIPEIMEVDNVSILSEAQLAESQDPVSPTPLLNILIAIVVGLLTGVGIAFLLEFLDKSIKNEEDIEKQLGLPILGSVPSIEEHEFKNTLNKSNSNTSLRSKSKSENRKTS